MDSGRKRAREVRAHYDEDAVAYQNGWAPVLLPHSLRLLEALPLADARRVADAGAGTGDLLPHLQRAAPRATVVAIDGSAGMLGCAPAGFPRAVVDLERLGLRDGCLDAAVSAFVLFHLTDPLAGLSELARALAPGGSIGTITWDGEPRFAAQLAWSEELDAHGAAPGTMVLNHEPLSSPERMTAILGQVGFVEVRAWTEPFVHRFGAEEFYRLRTTRGSSRRRVDSLPAQARRRFLDRVRERFATMDEEAFTDRSAMIFATAVRG